MNSFSGAGPDVENAYLLIMYREGYDVCLKGPILDRLKLVNSFSGAGLPVDNVYLSIMFREGYDVYLKGPNLDRLRFF